MSSPKTRVNAASGRTPAAALFVARHGQPVLGHVVGTVRPGGPDLALDPVFPIGSQTKPITSAVVLALAERGRIGLTEPVDFRSGFSKHRLCDRTQTGIRGIFVSGQLGQGGRRGHQQTTRDWWDGRSSGAS